MSPEANALMVLTALCLPAAAWCQTEPPAEFEVVSIKPMPETAPGAGSRIFGCSGGPGTSDPGLITCEHETARGLVILAHDFDFTRISFAELPGTDPQFEIAAKVPHGATKQQVRQMWQKLLATRFQLAVHRETREVPVYELVVAKGGFKAKEWGDRKDDPDASPWEPGKPPKLDKDGFPLLPAGQTISRFTAGKAAFVAAGTMHDMASFLEGRLRLNERTPRPVLDATGLTGKYDLRMWWSPKADHDDTADGPSMLSALESQLGLKLQPKKSAPVEMLIIDHLDRKPTEN